MTAINMQPALVKEPSTLVYTLTHPNVIDFDDFYLLVRANHGYMVERITPKPDEYSVHVRVGFQASVANFQAKLGALAPYIVVSKLSSLIQEHEYARLDELRRHYGLTAAPAVAAAFPSALPRVHNSPTLGPLTLQPAPEPVPTAPAPLKRAPKKQRPAPYRKSAKKGSKEATESTSVPVIQLSDDIPDTQECDVTYTYAEQENGKSGFYISDSTQDQQ